MSGAAPRRPSSAGRRSTVLLGCSAAALLACVVVAVGSGWAHLWPGSGVVAAPSTSSSSAAAPSGTPEQLISKLKDMQRHLSQFEPQAAAEHMHPTGSGSLLAPHKAEAAGQDSPAFQPPGSRVASARVRTTTTAAARGAGGAEGSEEASAVPGHLFTWGLGGSRSGRGGDNTIPGEALAGQEVLQVSGSAHTLMVVPGGEVWSMGRNDSQGGGGHGSPPIPDSGQLGRGGSEQYAPVGALRGHGRMARVAAGRYHSLALGADGRVYSWGLNDVGQLGRPGHSGAPNAAWDGCVSGPRCRSGWPQVVGGALQGLRVVTISAGRYWSIAATDDGRLFTWGMDGCATGVLPPVEMRWEPREVGGAVRDSHIVALDSGYILWVARSKDGLVFTCDTQDDGYAGTLEKKAPNSVGELGRLVGGLSPEAGFMPGQVKLPPGEAAVSVAAGRQHGLAVTESGRVYSWGHGGSLLGRDGDRDLPAPVEGFGPPPALRAVLVAAGEYFSLAATNDTVFGFGGNGYHMAGIGPSTSDVRRPTPVKGPLGAGGQWQILDLQAGYQHTMAIVRRHLPALTQPAARHHPQPHPQPHHHHPLPMSHPQPQQQQPSGGAVVSQHHAAAEQPMSIPPQSQVPLAAPGAAHGAAVDHTSYLEAQARRPTRHVAEYWEAWRWTDRHEAIKGTSPDIFAGLPDALDPAYKNPCFLKNGKLRCMPYFHILGVSKCGTTDLYKRLARHPQLKEAENKGPHFWDECVWPPQNACTVPPSGDWQGYLNLFNRAALQMSASQKERAAITGEASSNTFTASEVWLRGHDATRNNPKGVTIAELLREAQPYLRLIVIFRNPVERYFSAFHYYRDRRQPAPSAQDFHTRAKAEVDEWNRCVGPQQANLRNCVRGFNPQQLVKGMYVEFLHDWLTHFPREQLLFLRNEDYAAAPREHMAAVFSFLGIRQPFDAEWTAIGHMDRANSQKKSGMLPETRRMLEDFYAPYNARLAEALGDPRYKWD